MRRRKARAPLALYDQAQGVRGRSNDNTVLNEIIGWQPEITIQESI